MDSFDWSCLADKLAPREKLIYNPKGPFPNLACFGMTTGISLNVSLQIYKGVIFIVVKKEKEIKDIPVSLNNKVNQIKQILKKKKIKKCNHHSSDECYWIFCLFDENEKSVLKESLTYIKKSY